MSETNTNDGAAGAGDAGAAAGADGAQGAGAPGGSAYAAAAAAAGGDGAPPPLAERIPEKYRVQKEDGTLDLEASAAKLVDAHGSLEKRIGTGDLPPKTAEDYVPKVDGLDFEVLKEDPKFQSFLKGAHAKGLTNAQVEFVLGQYAERAADDVAVGMSAADFQREMQAGEWKEPGAYEANMKLGLRAIRGALPDITAEELASIPNHPIVARVLAKFGAEMGEDTQLRLQPIAAGDFETQLAALQANPAYTDARHPEHKIVNDQIAALFQKRYPERT